MISRNSEGGFFAAHWDWLVAGVGVLALVFATALFLMSGGTDPDDNAAESVRRIMSAKKPETGVKPIDMSGFERSLQLATKPLVVADVPEDDGSFLVSPCRVMCKFCEKPIPGNAKTCLFCKKDQPKPEKVVVDTDGDGLPDEWEKKYGLNSNVADADLDTDGDGFTNAEEYAAGTDPSDGNSHPSYLDYVKIQLPLRETFLPFFFEKAEQLPNGKVRYYFRDPKARNDYGGRGRQYNPLEGEEIGSTGYIVKKLEKKSMKVKIAASKTDKALERTKTVSLATIKRKLDGKELKLSDLEKRTPVDVQAELSFSRGNPSEFSVVPGKSFKLYGETYKVTEVKAVGKGARVLLEDRLGKIHTLEAVDQ